MMKLTERELSVVRRENLQWIFIAQGVTILPLLLQLPFWLWLVWGGALFWRIQIFRQRLPYPTSFTKFLIGMGTIVGLGVSYVGRMSVEPMVGFLVCSFVLKILELRTKKDALLILYIGFVAVSAQFLFAQTILASLYGVISCVVLITAWQTVFYSRFYPAKYKLKYGSLLVLKSLPMMLVFFLVMPRIGPLWSVPMPDSTGKTGFSDTLSPGDLGNLVKSNGVAFRVAFTGAAPPSSQLYWRGLVLDSFDGRAWRLRQDWRESASRYRSEFPDDDSGIRYEVVIEPHRQKWLFSLMPVMGFRSAVVEANITGDYLLAASKPVVTRAHYKVHSATNMKSAQSASHLSRHEFYINTLLPEAGNPKARALAQEWKLQGLKPEVRVQKALDLYAESFFYTLQPPILRRDPIDEFLFKTQRGFCEHYASSFVFLMRAAGVPSRVVVGYQGGMRSDIDDYFVVSQSDAHAWAEVWIDGTGWRRIDPTAYVAPDRIEMGLSQALNENERAMLGQGVSSSNSLFGFAQRYWDSVGYSWHRWVLGYDKDMQSGIFDKLLGGADYWRVGLALTGSGLLIFGIYALAMFRNRNKPYLHPEAILFMQFEKKVARHDISRRSEESASSFARRVARISPELSSSALKIAELHDAIAYGGQLSKMPLLQKYVQAFPSLP